MKRVLSLGLLTLFGALSTLVLAEDASSLGESSAGIQTIDHYVSHISTIPANKGEAVKLFVREKIGRDVRGNKPAVLMIAGATQSAITTYDLQFENYSWMAFLARAGFDVFAMDFQGYGLSTRPMMDQPCNAARSQQVALLVPKPLSAPCDASYPYRLGTSQSDWDEMNSVVNYIRRLRGARKVSLLGWSLGGFRVGGYVARHADNVDKIVLSAPSYDRRISNDPPAVLPERGVPLTVRTIASFTTTWDGQVGCEFQFTPAIRDALRSSILQVDPVGSSWGTEPMWRAPVYNTFWGLNPSSASQVKAPTMIIVGELDMQAPKSMSSDLYQDVGTDHKVFVRVACAGHQLVWENRHMILLRASRDWLRDGTFAGQRSGSYWVDASGKYHKDQ